MAFIFWSAWGPTPTRCRRLRSGSCSGHLSAWTAILLSYLFCKRIAQTVEQKVSEQKQPNGGEAQREQPFPVLRRPAGGGGLRREDQNLLIGDRQVRERIQIQIRANPLRRAEPGVDDGRREKPQRHHVAENVLQVSKMHRKSR